MSKQGLFDEFPEVSAKQWKQKIQVDLKGADYNETLVWESPEGIKVKPFYHSEDLENSEALHLSQDHSWNIAQPIYAGNTEKANVKALDCLGRGAESLIFTIPDPETDFAKLFSGIDVTTVLLHFEFGFLEIAPIQRLLDILQKNQAKAYLNIDPFGHLARTGNWFHSLEKDQELLAQIVGMVEGDDKIVVPSIDVSLYQNAGSNMVQQLAYALAQANEYLNLFAIASDVDKKHFPMTFKVSVGGNYFFEIAKLKALRWLWKSLASSYGLETGCHIVACPSTRNKTLYDYNVNMLRTTSECMSAILGGANTVCNVPYDAIYHKENEFGNRIARNQLLLLREESYFGQTSHAAEGSYYIASLTEQLAEKALELFKQIENSGGFLDELKKGTLQRKIKESASKEQQLFDANELVLLGTNAYKNPENRMKGELELFPFVKTKPRKTLVEPIIPKRLAENLEQKRLDDE